MTDVFDLHLNAIALFHKQRRIALFAYTTRRPGDDHVAGAETGKGTDVLDQFRNFVDHAAGVVFLHHTSIKPGADREAVRIRDFISGRHPRAKCPGLPPVFPGGKPGVLPVAGGTVHVAAVAADVAQGVFTTDVLAAFADDHRQLTFVVKFTGVARFEHRRIVPGL
ncbi:hypothetical protein D3C86_1475400 [compost metagenome]